MVGLTALLIDTLIERYIDVDNEHSLEWYILTVRNMK